MINLSARHQSTQEVMRWFEYDHLDSPLKEFSQQVHDLAVNMVNDLPDSPELTVGLRKLLEAKDCFVRASMPPRPVEEPRRPGAVYPAGVPEGTGV